MSSETARRLIMFNKTMTHVLKDPGLKLAQALEGRKWDSVVRLLQRHQYSDQQRDGAIALVLTEAKKTFVKKLAKSRFWLDHLDTVLTHLVRRRFWDCVSNVLQRGLSDAQYREAVQNSTSRACSEDFTTYVLSFCSQHDLKLLLASFVEKNMWDVVEKVLQGDVSDSQRRLAIEVCSDMSATDDFIGRVLCRCSDDVVDIALTNLVRQRMWKAAVKLLQRGANDQLPICAVEDCSRHNNCSKDQLGSLLKHLVTRGLWKAAENVLQQGVTVDCQRWAVNEYSKRSTGDEFIKYALPFCSKDQLDSVLKNLVERNLWKAAEKVLQQDVSVDCQRWAVEECSKRAPDYCFTMYALHYCSKDQLDSVLVTLVRRNLWKAVDKVLQQGVSDSCRRCAVEECSQRASGYDFVQYALPYCAENDLDSVLSNLVKRCEWEAAGKMLCQFKPCTNSENGKDNAGGKEKTDFYCCILLCHYVHILPFLEVHKHWNTIVNLIHDIVCETLCAWVKSGKRSPHVDAFWAIVENYRVSATCTVYLFSLMKGAHYKRNKQSV